MSSLYADENFAYPAVVQLRSWGHDVLTAQQAGQAGHGIPDSAVLLYAIGQGRGVLTFNRRHFIRLHRQNPHHHGIIVCTRDDDTLALVGRIHRAITPLSSLDGQLIRIVRPPLSTP